MNATNQLPRRKAPWECAVDKALEIIKAIDSDLPDEAWDAAESFFTDVRLRVGQVIETIERTHVVTEKQAKALVGWHAGVQAWVK